jgi:hypothetical protein
MTACEGFLENLSQPLTARQQIAQALTPDFFRADFK